MKKVYPVIFTKTPDKKDTILIEVPDLDILTEGFGTANAIDMARDAIGLLGITLEDKKEVMAEPSDINNISIEQGKFYKSGTSYVSLVDVDFAEYRRKVDTKSVRRNVTLPHWLNVEADKAGINVSKVLQKALMSALQMHKY